MTFDQIKQYLENQIEPKLAELGTSYVILVENKQFYIIYNGELDKIAYMLGRTLQELLDSQENNEEAQNIIGDAFEAGCKENVEGEEKEEF